MVISLVKKSDKVNLVNSFKVFEDLEQTKSGNRKMAILKEQINNEILKSLFLICFNPFKLLQIKKDLRNKKEEFDLNKQLFNVSFKNYLNFLNLTDRLSKRVITGNKSRLALIEFLQNCNALEQKWYMRIIQKDLKAGVSEVTINKVWKKLIPEFKIQKADKFDGKFFKRTGLEPKLDGFRCLAHKYPDLIVLLTSNGHQMNGFEEIERELKLFPDGYIYDGEITSNNFNAMSSSAFKHAKGKRAFLNIFDIIPISDFYEECYLAPAEVRRTLLETIYNDIIKTENLRFISLVPQKSYTDITMEQLEEEYKAVLDQGFEGIMIKDLSKPYVCKRGKHWLKLKPVDTFDIEIVDVQEGEGRLKNSLGALVCSFNGNTVNVGSGFSDELRKELWNKRNQLVGKIIEVKAQEITTNKSGENSLRFPIFKRMREDK